MDAITNKLGEDEELELKTELEIWDWVRAAGVSADELRRVLDASLPAFELRKAA
jgi:hypothetical protein